MLLAGVLERLTATTDDSTNELGTGTVHQGQRIS